MRQRNGIGNVIGAGKAQPRGSMRVERLEGRRLFAISDPFGYEATSHDLTATELDMADPLVTRILRQIDEGIEESDDDAVEAIPLAGNTFNFYGQTFSGGTALFASPNGLISFGQPGFDDFNNVSLPDAGISHPIIAPLWNDWGPHNVNVAVPHDEPVGYEGVVYKLEPATQDAERLVIQWTNLHDIADTASTVTFQAVLELNTGSRPGVITFNYFDLTTDSLPDFPNDNGLGATVGIQSDPNLQPAPGSLQLAWDEGHEWVQTDKSIQIATANEPPPNQVPTADAGGPYTVTEGGQLDLSGRGSTDPDGDTLDYEWDLDYDGVTFDVDATGVAPQFSATLIDGPATRTVALRVTDDDGASATDTAVVTVTNANPVAQITGAAAGPVPLGTTVNFTGLLSDAGTADTHTAVWTIIGAAGTETTPGTVTESAGAGAVAGAYTFTTPGVYNIRLTVTDDDGASHTADSIGELAATVVVYDPAAGFVTGGGWIDSPAGAFAGDPTLTGKASFAFVARYKDGAATGTTEFQFRAGALNFRSSGYESLVVGGHRAQFRGTGTVNGVAGYRFKVTIIDGEKDGTGQDKFRIRIWGPDGILYDNQMSSGEDADPTTVLGGGSIVIHAK